MHCLRTRKGAAVSVIPVHTLSVFSTGSWIPLSCFHVRHLSQALLTSVCCDVNGHALQSDTLSCNVSPVHTHREADATSTALDSKSGVTFALFCPHSNFKSVSLNTSLGLCKLELWYFGTLYSFWEWKRSKTWDFKEISILRSSKWYGTVFDLILYVFKIV